MSSRASDLPDLCDLVEVMVLVDESVDEVSVFNLVMGGRLSVEEMLLAAVFLDVCESTDVRPA